MLLETTIAVSGIGKINPWLLLGMKIISLQCLLGFIGDFLFSIREYSAGDLRLLLGEVIHSRMLVAHCPLVGGHFDHHQNQLKRGPHIRGFILTVWLSRMYTTSACDECLCVADSLLAKIE